MDQHQANIPTKNNTLPGQPMNDTDARLVARLKQILDTPGISDKDRKLLERNLQRLLSPTNNE